MYQVDAFTTEKFKGNPAGVVLNADGLTDPEMLSIAREMNNSETAFVFKPDGPDHEVKIRYFTPKAEVPICGHATIAAHYVRAVQYGLSSSTILQKIGIGILPVEIIKENNDYSIVMTQGNIVYLPSPSREEKESILQALGLIVEDLDERCPIQILSTGNPKVMIGIKSIDKLNTLSPDMQALVQISKVINCSGYFVFTLDSRQKNVLTHGRMFAPAIGINEDPVTGNANGPLGAYLIKNGIVHYNGPNYSFTGEQGTALGRSGLVDVSVRLENGEPTQIKIGGKAVIVFETVIQI